MSGQPLDDTNALIIVFAMHGCPACEDFLPRFIQQVDGFQQLGHPFVIHAVGQQLQPGQIPVAIYDSNSRDPELQKLADFYQIQNLPSTMLLSKRGQFHKHEGALDDSQIYSLLVEAVRYNR